jgi:hypothetical protein
MVNYTNVQIPDGCVLPPGVFWCGNEGGQVWFMCGITTLKIPWANLSPFERSGCIARCALWWLELPLETLTHAGQNYRIGEQYRNWKTFWHDHERFVLNAYHQQAPESDSQEQPVRVESSEEIVP